jgi:hypothetical protein
MATEQVLIKKLDEFIRKYYKNRLIRGILWVCALLGAFYLFMIALEYFFHFTQVVRTILFFVFMGSCIVLLARLVLIPLLQLLRIGKIITHDQAAVIIGRHFSEIQDKLLNTLQLIRRREEAGESAGLLAASIEQKTLAMKVFRFSIVIDFRKNLRYLRYALIPLMVILILVFVSPKTISDPTRRILQFNRPFTKPLPFKVELLSKNLTALQQEDFELKIQVTGEEIPADFFVRIKDNTFKMTRDRGFLFSHLFKSLQGNVIFSIIAGDFRSEEYEIKVFPKPIILNFDVLIKYPGYINKPDEKVENIGDFTIPEGSTLVWNFHTRDVTSIRLRMGNDRIELKNGQDRTFSYTARILKSLSYCMVPLNANTFMPDSLTYRINVVNDGYPTIFMNESADSAFATTLFFKGTIKDDYGFSKLCFNYCVFTKGDTATSGFNVENIPIEKSINNQVFYYTTDLLKLMPEAGKSIKYYFEVWDNDGIHGPKATRSEMKMLSTPTIEEINLHTGQNEKSINQDLEHSISDSKTMKKTMEELNRKLVDQSAVSWQEKKKIEDVIKANMAIEERIEQIKKKNEENILNEEKYLETSERIIEKQNQLKELMNQLLTEEMKKMIEELKALLNQVDKTKLSDLLEKMKMSNKDLETQLDRDLALMKQIEFDRKLENMVKDLRKNADEQEKLANNTEKQLKPDDELFKEQKKIKDKADSLAKQLNNLEKEGKQLETPANLGNTKQKQDSIGKNLEDSKNNLKQNRKAEAAESQKKAAKQMKDLAQQLEESQQESEDDQLAEDASNVRMILENLVRLSFEQEEMIKNTRIIVRNDPKYTEIVFRQKEFGEKLKVVEDSLNAIAKRQVMIKPVVSREIAAVNKNISETIDAMDSRNISLAVTKQQFTMTSLNNLALLLNESLEKMNEQKAMSMKSKSGNKSCKNPSSKGGKMSAKSMKEMQQKIGQQLEKLKSGIEGAKKQGKGNKQENGALNREIAKMAAQQEALRNEMQKYQDEMGLKGTKDQGNLNEAANEMEQLEKDMINKNITQESMRRQQTIVSRLLESEKAEQTREQEEKRESTEAKSQKISNPGLNFQYNTKRKASQDNIQLFLPYLSSFFKDKVNSYIVKIEH